MKTKYLTPDQLDQVMTISDLTDPDGPVHALQAIVSHVGKALSAHWRANLLAYRSCPVVTTKDNYDDLGYPVDGAARDAKYSRYLSSSLLLRTQTSAAIPRLLRALSPTPPEDLVITCAGLVYRRDVIDRLHVGEPHQIDLWRITKKPMGKRDLEKMIELVCSTILPTREYRITASPHPYTVDGVQIDVKAGNQWVEIGECGVADPGLLRRCGLPEQITGLAMGLGLDRLMMLRKNMDDIRLLRSSDPRVRKQMENLDLWQVVSNQPATTRDLSVCVSNDLTPEEIGDRVRDSLGEDASCLEELSIVSETPYADLPPAARERMGMAVHQRNILIRLTIRHPDRTLTAVAGNHLRDRVYLALHEGSRKELAVIE